MVSLGRWIGGLPAGHIFFFVGTLVAVGSLLITLERFFLGSAICALAAMSLSAWVCTLTFGRHLRRHIWPRRIAGMLVISIATATGIATIYDYKLEQELKSNKGYLSPDNLATPTHRCFSSNPPAGTLQVYLGRGAFVVTNFHRIRFAVEGKVIFAMEALPEGDIGLSADIRTPEDKIVVSIDKNFFRVNPNTTLDFDREGSRSKLVIYDEYGDALSIHYLNRATVSITGVIKVGFTRIVLGEDKTEINSLDNKGLVVVGGCATFESVDYTYNLDYK